MFQRENVTLQAFLDKIRLDVAGGPNIVIFDQLTANKKAILARHAASLKVSVRARGVFQRLRITYVGELLQLSPNALMSQKNCGRTTLKEIEDELQRLDLGLDTTIVGWSEDEAQKILLASNNAKSYTHSDDLIDLEAQVRHLLGGYCSPKLVDATIRFYGFDGSGRKTLEAVGQEYDVTRERIRQIVAKVRGTVPSSEKLCMLSAVSSAVELVESLIPGLATDIQEALLEAGLTACPFDLTGLESVFEFDDEPAPFEIIEHEDTSLVVPSGMGAFVGDVNSASGRLVSRWGVTTVSEVCAQTGMSVSPELVRLILSSRPDLCWLDESKDWFSLPNQKRNRLLNMIRKVLSVGTPLKLSELRKAISRHHRMRGFAPPQAILLNFCRTNPFIAISDEVVSTLPGEWDVESTLGKNEQDIVDVLRQIGPIART
ncbi:MAG: DNA-directed RNA polymerase subunit alpha C-terminal domain-containing protein, partial [Rhodomicrobium sp.]